MRETNVRVLFPEDVSVGRQQNMLVDHDLAVHHARGCLKTPVYRLAVQDLHLTMLHFGEGRSYNEALTDACNKALRYRDEALKKQA